MAEPWERQPKESAKAFQAFGLYRDMGPERSIRAVGEQLGKSETLLERWSAAHKWRDRCAAYDDYLDRAAVRAAAAEREAVRNRQLKMALTVQEKAFRAFMDPDFPMTPVSVLQMMKFSIELEREIRCELLETAAQQTAETEVETLLTAIMSGAQRRTEDTQTRGGGGGGVSGP